MTEWTWGDSARLVGRAYCWLVGVTVPAVTIAWTLALTGVALVLDPRSALGIGGADLLGALVFLLLWDVAVAVAATAGAVVALPFSFVLGLLLRRVQSWAPHIVAAAALAGALGGVSAGWIWGHGGMGSGLGFGALIGVSAAAAGAIARWRQLVVAARETTVSQPWPPAVTP